MKPDSLVLTKLAEISPEAVTQYLADCGEWASIEAMGEAGPPSKDSRAGRHPETVPGTGFADGERVATCEPDVYFDDPEEAGRDVFTEKLSNFLSWLVEGDSVTSAGRKALLLAHLAGRSAIKDDSALAKRLGVSKARISQLRKQITNGYRGFASAKGVRA